MRRVQVLVSGSVQGVCFRASVKDMAQSTGVSGWVRNTDDGKVEALFEGEEKSVDRLLDFCLKGPPGASVSGIQITEEKPEGNMTGFAVKS